MSQFLTRTLEDSNKPNDIELYRRDSAAHIAPAVVENDERTVDLTWASDTPYKRYFWNLEGYADEVLDMGVNSVNVSRFNDGLGCVLFNHDRDQVIGVVESINFEGNRAHAMVRFAKDTDSEKVYQQIKDGIIKGVSVGYNVSEYTVLRNEEDVYRSETGATYKGPAMIATKWEPYEISIVSIPADASVGVGRDAQVIQQHETAARFVYLEEGKEMPEKETKQTTVVAAAGTDDAMRAAAMEAEKAERQRASSILTLCRELGDENAQTYINENLTLEQAQERAFEARRARLAANTAVQSTAEQERQQGATDEMKFRAAATDALLLRHGGIVDAPAAGADELRGLSVKGLATELLIRSGETGAYRMDEKELLERSLASTSALPGILGNVANKSLLAAYQEAPTTFEQFTVKGSNTDFKPAKRYRLSEAGALKRILENGEFVEDHFTEAEYGAVLGTFGRSFSFTREMMINDDLSALVTIPRMYALATRRGINQMVFEVLNGYDYPTAQVTNASSLTIAKAIKSARSKMFKLKGLKGESTLGLRPEMVVAPSDIDFELFQLFNSTAAVEGVNSGVANPYRNLMKVVTDGELDMLNELNKVNNMYLIANPRAFQGIEVTYLQGRETPTIESQVQFNVLGIKYRVYHDVGVNMIDPIGIHKITRFNIEG